MAETFRVGDVVVVYGNMIKLVKDSTSTNPLSLTDIKKIPFIYKKMREMAYWNIKKTYPKNKTMIIIKIENTAPKPFILEDKQGDTFFNALGLVSMFKASKEETEKFMEIYTANKVAKNL